MKHHPPVALLPGGIQLRPGGFDALLVIPCRGLAVAHHHDLGRDPLQQLFPQRPVVMGVLEDFALKLAVWNIPNLLALVSPVNSMVRAAYSSRKMRLL